ncbi:MAG: mycofactocin-associated electron transfer flavoprotein beta subunit [Ilumatobacteraceae bacterium]
MIVVCWKWVTAGDERWSGVSDADRAALEVGLRLAETSSTSVTVATVGPPAAEHGLREAIAAGAADAIRIEAPDGLASDAVAVALAAVAADASWIVCGDASADRGTGAVPAFLAAELGVAQALGLIGVTPDERTVRATRRLDGGRREILDVTTPAVLSVEGSVARLRRASLRAELTARSAAILQVAGPPATAAHAESHDVQPYRPRARAFAAPAGVALDRVRLLTDVAGGPAPHAELVVLDPPAAAERILAALAEWGYLSP